MQTFYCSSCNQHYKLQLGHGPPAGCKRFECNLFPVQSTMEDIATARDPLLTEREKTHGSFAINAHLYNEFKSIGLELPQHLNEQQQLALDMIYLKLSRILSNPKTRDSWLDVAGYAKLGSEACDA